MAASRADAASLMLDALALPLALAVGALGASRLACVALGSSDRELGFGARVASGVALLAVPAGCLVATGVYSRSAALVLLGFAGLGLLVPQRAARTAAASDSVRRIRTLDALALAALAAFALARTAGALRFPHYNACDDWIAYLHFPRLLLESGGFEEPFGMRRLGVLGAGPFVQGFFWPSLGISANALADAVFGQLALIGGAFAVRDACAPATRSLASSAAFALAALLATLTIPYLNTLPVLLPYGVTLLLLALHARTLLREPDAESTRDAMLFGVLSALLIGLRVSNAVVPAALWALELARALWRGDRARMRLSGIAALATGLALLPWCVSLWRSSGTPLFPLLLGNYRFPTLFSEPLGARQLARFLVECLLANRVLVLVALAGLAGFARRERRALAAQVAAALFVFVLATAHSATAFDSYTVLRYCAPLGVAALLFLAALTVFGPAGSRWPRAAVAAAAAVWLLVPVTTHRVFDPTRFSLLGFAAGDAREWTRALEKVARDPFTLEEFVGAEPYEEAQRLLPAGARVVAAAEQAYLWRHDMHTIHGLDCLGQASPDPGMPFFAGADAMAEYLGSLGYTHLAFTPPRRGMCLYSSAHWLSHRAGGQWMWRQWAPYFLDFMQTERELARTREILYRAPTLVVVDLRTRAAVPPTAPRP